MNPTDCPNQDRISRFLLGTLDENECEQVANHLATCSQCQAVADGLERVSDPLIDILRSPPPELPYVDEPQCRGAFERLTTLRSKFPLVFEPSNEPSDLQDEWRLPQILGDYLITGRIGGYQGAVYKAIHTALGREVVLKMLPDGLLADEAAAERFRREIEAIGRLDHPNIVRAMDARQVGNRRFLVMEYVDGCNLAELVQHCTQLPIAEACELVRQAAMGLQYICQNGLVHRDIKPSNLLSFAKRSDTDGFRTIRYV